VASAAAYQSAKEAIQKTQSYKDPACTGSNLAESLLHERAYSLDHFASAEEKSSPKTQKLTTEEATEAILKQANRMTHKSKSSSSVSIS